MPPSHHLDIDRQTDAQGRNVLVSSGVIDLRTAGSLRDQIHEVGTSGETVVVDLEQVHFMDSPGLGILIHCDRVLRDRGAHLVLRRPTGAVLDLLDIVQLASTIDIEPT